MTGSYDKTAIVWDTASEEQVAQLKGHTKYVNAASFNHDGTQIVTGSYDKTAIVWDVASGQQVAQLTGHTHNVNAASFNHDGTRIVTGSFDNTAIVWDVASGQQVAQLTGHTSTVRAASFNHDGTQIVTGSGDHTAFVWDAAKEETSWMRANTGRLLSAAELACGTSWMKYTNQSEPIKAILVLATLVRKYGAAANFELQKAQDIINKYAGAVRETVNDLSAGSDLEAVTEASDAASKLAAVHTKLFGDPNFKPALELRCHREALGVGYGTDWRLTLQENFEKAKLAGLLDGKGTNVPDAAPGSRRVFLVGANDKVIGLSGGKLHFTKSRGGREVWTLEPASQLKLKVGSSPDQIKEVDMPVVANSIRSKPANTQNPEWNDKFRVELKDMGKKATITRIDETAGWGQELELMYDSKSERVYLCGNNGRQIGHNKELHVYTHTNKRGFETWYPKPSKFAEGKVTLKRAHGGWYLGANPEEGHAQPLFFKEKDCKDWESWQMLDLREHLANHLDDRINHILNEVGDALRIQDLAVAGAKLVEIKVDAVKHCAKGTQTRYNAMQKRVSEVNVLIKSV